MSEKSDLEKLVIQIQSAGQEWVEAKLQADQLEEDAKNFLAALMNDLEPAVEKPSESKLERLARGSKEYREYILGMCGARAEANRKRIRYESFEKLFEAKRSDLSLEREKIAKGIYHEGR